MKKIILISLMLQGCATAIPLSYREHCALRGMVLDGVSTNSSSGTSVGITEIISVSDESSENIHCSLPRNDADKCMVQNLGKKAAPKAEYNDGIGGKRTLTAIGYVFYVVPGLLLKSVYDNQRDKALEESRNTASSSCGNTQALNN